ncbi:hypothetical protein BJ912DRAFT_1043401 [Pholiota molesta]|nr:hypothetical protein BJ912DRAFT_1043401 [Pholiota molesta]
MATCTLDHPQCKLSHKIENFATPRDHNTNHRIEQGQLRPGLRFIITGQHPHILRNCPHWFPLPPAANRAPTGLQGHQLCQKKCGCRHSDKYPDIIKSWDEAWEVSQREGAAAGVYSAGKLILNAPTGISAPKVPSPIVVATSSSPYELARDNWLQVTWLLVRSGCGLSVGVSAGVRRRASVGGLKSVGPQWYDSGRQQGDGDRSTGGSTWVERQRVSESIKACERIAIEVKMT